MCLNSKSMMLVTSKWKSGVSFKLIPTTKECPYTEVVYNPEEKILYVLSKEKYNTFQMLPRLSDIGSPIPAKGFKNDKGRPIEAYKEQRMLVETFYEYAILVPKEMELFIDTFATNASDYDYKAFMVNETTQGKPEVVKPKKEAKSNKKD